MITAQNSISDTSAALTHVAKVKSPFKASHRVTREYIPEFFELNEVPCSAL